MRHSEPAAPHDAAEQTPEPSPVVGMAPDIRRRAPREGIALCLSGGGFRAMLFHVGALWRLNELGYLPRLARVSSVSGGSITAGVLALAWGELAFGDDDVARDFEPCVVEPLRRFAGRTVDIPAVLRGVLLPGTVAQAVARSYRRHLFGDATLQSLPRWPRFVINASNVQSGVLWRFSRPFMRDYRVGEVRRPRLPLATAVAASSAFPPFLSPCVLRLDAAAYTAGSGHDLQRPPFTTRVVLTDGGVYDNLGLETAWKLYRTVLVSDGGAQMPAQGRPAWDWLRQTRRALDVIDNQVGALRKRRIVAAYLRRPRDPTDSTWRDGAYWGIGKPVGRYPIADPLPCPAAATARLAAVATRLARLDRVTQERLINWGYAACDAAMRSYVVDPAPAPAFPYPTSAVG